MWLRDSSAQVWPYLGSVRDDTDARPAHPWRHPPPADQILLDPYCDASWPTTRPSEWANDCRPRCAPEVSTSGSGSRTPCSRSAACLPRYAIASRSLQPFDARVARRARAGPSAPCAPSSDSTAAARTDSAARTGTRRTTCRISARARRAARTGWSHGAFRPSDDASVLPLNVPVNLALAAALDAVASRRRGRRCAAPPRCASGRIACGDPGWRRARRARPRRSRRDLGVRGGRRSAAGCLMDDANAQPPLAPVLRRVRSRQTPIYRRHPPLDPLAREPVVVPWLGRRGRRFARTRAPGVAWPIAVAMRGLTGDWPGRERLAAVPAPRRDPCGHVPRPRVVRRWTIPRGSRGPGSPGRTPSSASSSSVPPSTDRWPETRHARARPRQPTRFSLPVRFA